MTRIDLKRSSGFPLIYEGDLLNTFDFLPKKIDIYPLTSLKNQLLNDEVNCPEIFYTIYHDIDRQNEFKNLGIQVNIVVLMPNLAGVEFVKTKALAVNSHKIIDVLHGGGCIVMQNFKDSYDGKIFHTNLKKSQKIVVPKNYQHTVVNTKQTPMIFLEITKRNIKLDDSLDDMRGMSYYVIRKNAKQEIVRNPVYRLVPSAKKINYEKIISNLGITSKTPIIKQITKNTNRYDWLFNDYDINI